MLKIGLTGGIGSGKSTIADLFKHYSIPIIDADIISRQLVQPKQAAHKELRESFGSFIFNDDDTLNRAKLSKLIFSNSKHKKQVEDILHPLIYQQMQCEFNQQTSAYSILCIPLLMETNMTAFVDRVLVVDCSVETQIERVQQRDQFSKEHILSIISSQVSRQYRVSHADDIINNSKSVTQLAEQVKKLHNQYILLSKS